MGVLRDRRVVVLLVLVLAGSVLSVVLALDRPRPEGAGVPPGSTGTQAPGFRPADLLGPGGDALDVAVTALAAGLSYDHRDLDGSVSEAVAQLTPAYAATIAAKFDRRFRASVERRGLVVEGLVRGAGVVRTSGDSEVVCLLYVDQMLVEDRAQSSGEGPRVLSRYRARAEVVLVDGRWRVDRIDLTSVDAPA